MSEAAARLFRIETELTRYQSEYDGLRGALVDPKITTWVTGTGRQAPRQLTAFELATVKRLDVLRPKIRALQNDAREIIAEIVLGLAKVDGGAIDDPEVLLRASLVVLTKTARGSVEGRAVSRALIDYLKSLAGDE